MTIKVGFYFIQVLRTDPVYRQPLLNNGLDAMVNFIAGAFDDEFRLGEPGQFSHIFRKIAFVAATNQPVASTKRTDDFRGRSNQRDNALRAGNGHRRTLANSSPGRTSGLAFVKTLQDTRLQTMLCIPAIQPRARLPALAQP